MAMKTMDALTSFLYLTDHLPGWLTQINTLSTYAAQKHADFVADYARLLKMAQEKPSRPRTPSLHSLHTDRDEPPETTSQLLESTPHPTPSTPVCPEINHLEPGNRYLLANARRKRKPGSTVRSGASGPPKFRSKHMVIVYYDSYLQEQLEEMVKGIGAARNNLRKGKISRNLIQGLQLPSFSKHFDNNDDVCLSSIKKSIVSTRSPPPDPKQAAANSRPDRDAIFTQADKQLEQAQVLCETAAHQFLRDGDCNLEMQDARKKLETALELAKDAVRTLREEEDARKVGEDAEVSAEETVEATANAEIKPITSAKMAPILNEKMELVPSLVIGAESAAIEVDDDSDCSSIVVDISKFRNARAIRA